VGRLLPGVGAGKARQRKMDLCCHHHVHHRKLFDILPIHRQARLSVCPSPPSTWLGQSSQKALHGVVTWTNAIGLTLEKQRVMVFKNSHLFVEAKQLGARVFVWQQRPFLSTSRGSSA
jgi:hypothetical protein